MNRLLLMTAVLTVASAAVVSISGSGSLQPRRFIPRPRLCVPMSPGEADWAAERPPELSLPPNALVLEEPDEAVWSDETLEFNGLRADPRTPLPLQAYLTSLRLPNGRYCHAFDGSGVSLSQFASKAAALDDASRLRLITQLFDAVEFLHSRGSAHLGLDAHIVRIVDDDGDAAGAGAGGRGPQLRVIGLGAAIRLGAASGRTAYQMANAVSFHAPELLSSAILNSNLRALFLLDSWAVGVLLAMLCGSRSASPFDSEADWTRGTLTVEQAVRTQITAVQADYGGFLLGLDAGSAGFVFRHGWVVRLLLGLLAEDPTQRLTVHQAWEIATEATAGTVPLGAPEFAADELGAAAPLGSPALAPDGPTDAAATAAAEERSTSSAEAVDDAKAPRPNELERFRSLAAKDSSGEPFRSLEAMLNIADRGGAYISIQRRPWPGVKNYGEVIGFRNRADGDRWDVFVPGLSEELPEGEPLPLRKVLGVVLVKGGNHKLAVELHPPYALDEAAKEQVALDIKAFTTAYVQTHTVSAARVKYLALDELDY